MSTVPIVGIGDVYINPEEATSNKLLEDYMKWMRQIEDIFSQPNTPPFSSADFQKLQEAVAALKKLAVEGDRTSLGGPYYMPKDMLGKLNMVFSWLQIEGFKLDGNMTLEQGLDAMAKVKEAQTKDPSGNVVTFETVVTNALGELSGANRSLQSMLYTEFVLSTNGKYEAKLSDLEEQLKLTKEISQTLANMQDWRNKFVTAPNSPGWNNGELVGPTIKEPTAEDIAKLKEYRDQLAAQLEQIDPSGTERLKDGSLASSLSKVLDDLKFLNDPAAAKATLDKLPPSTNNGPELLQWAIQQGLVENPGSPVDNPTGYLAATIKALTEAQKARKDFIKSQGLPYTTDENAMSKINEVRDAAGKGDWDTVKWAARYWLMDNQDKVSNESGNFQDRLNKAIGAAQSLNDTQKEELRSAQYDYEQFMKMATTLMQIIHKIIEEPAKALGR